MSNITFITIPKKLTVSMVESAVDKVNVRRFKGRLSIERTSLISGDGDNWWNVHLPDTDFQFDFGIESYRKLGSKSPHLDCDMWAWSVFMAEMGVELQGRMSSERCAEHWTPDSHKYPTYRDWCLYMSPGFKQRDPEAFEEYFLMVRSYVPPRLLDIVEFA